jgi:hypothetical protein
VEGYAFAAAVIFRPGTAAAGVAVKWWFAGLSGAMDFALFLRIVNRIFS